MRLRFRTCDCGTEVQRKDEVCALEVCAAVACKSFQCDWTCAPVLPKSRKDGERSVCATAAKVCAKVSAKVCATMAPKSRKDGERSIH